MGLFRPNYEKAGPGVKRDEPKKKNFGLFFATLKREWRKLFLLNLLFLLFCIPVVTIPAAVTALTRLTLLMVQDKPFFLWDEFFRSFKREFGRSLLIGIVVLLLAAVLGFGALYYFALQTLADWALIGLAAMILLMLALFMVAEYMIAQLSLVALPMGSMFTNAVKFAAGFLPRNLVCILFWLILPLILILFPLAIILVPFWFCSFEALILAVMTQPAAVLFTEED